MWEANYIVVKRFLNVFRNNLMGMPIGFCCLLKNVVVCLLLKEMALCAYLHGVKRKYGDK